jgi:hypothetical protein
VCGLRGPMRAEHLAFSKLGARVQSYVGLQLAGQRMPLAQALQRWSLNAIVALRAVGRTLQRNGSIRQREYGCERRHTTMF